VSMAVEECDVCCFLSVFIFVFSCVQTN
jgi:hypothetical protein